LATGLYILQSLYLNDFQDNEILYDNWNINKRTFLFLHILYPANIYYLSYELYWHLFALGQHDDNLIHNHVILHI